MREASLQALKESLRNAIETTNEENKDTDDVLVVQKNHFKEALKNIKPSVTDEVRYFRVPLEKCN